MKKFYARITRKRGTEFFPAGCKSFEVGAYSMRELLETLDDIDGTGYADLQRSAVEIYTVEI